jgi:hypothetical protein
LGTSPRRLKLTTIYPQFAVIHWFVEELAKMPVVVISIKTAGYAHPLHGNNARLL